MSSTGCADELRYEYVRLFEQPDTLLANTWIVVRIDGRGFSKYVLFAFSLSSSQDVIFRYLGMQVPVTRGRSWEYLISWPQAKTTHERL